MCLGLSEATDCIEDEKHHVSRLQDHDPAIHLRKRRENKWPDCIGKKKYGHDEVGLEAGCVESVSKIGQSGREHRRGHWRDKSKTRDEDGGGPLLVFRPVVWVSWVHGARPGHLKRRCVST